MSFTVVFVIVITLYASAASETASITVLSGSTAQFDCNTSFAPVWAKINTKQGKYKTIAINGKKHPNFRDARFTFTNKETIFKMEISRVSSADAGTYVCDGEKSHSFLLNVVR